MTEMILTQILTDRKRTENKLKETRETWIECMFRQSSDCIEKHRRSSRRIGGVSANATK